MDNRIDERYRDSVTLICNKCNTLCSTKNIGEIGSRAIMPAWDEYKNHSINYLSLEKCNNLEHKISDLRLLTDKEFETFKEEGAITKHNVKFIEDDF